MKKLRLKALSLGAREILSREQLRSITGGCTQDSDCTGGNICNSSNQCTGDNGGGSDPGSSGSGGGTNCSISCWDSDHNSIGGSATYSCDSDVIDAVCQQYTNLASSSCSC